MEQNYIKCDSVDFDGFPQLPALSTSEFRLLNRYNCIQALWAVYGGTRAILVPVSHLQVSEHSDLACKLLRGRFVLPSVTFMDYPFLVCEIMNYQKIIWGNRR